MEAEMKRTIRILAILALVTGAGAATTWKITVPTEQPAPASLVQAGNPAMDEALYRYRHDLPRHWRDVMFGW
jgi:hypothetical protein